MAIPKMPWYGTIEKIVAPTEQVSNVMLLVILAVTIVILARGNTVAKAAWVVYVVSP